MSNQGDALLTFTSFSAAVDILRFMGPFSQNILQEKSVLVKKKNHLKKTCLEWISIHVIY